MKLHIFNPETDFAHSVSGHQKMTPKKRVIEMRRRLAPVMALLADEGDAVFFLDGVPRKNDMPDFLSGYFRERNIKFCDENDLQNILAGSKDIGFSPWGWNWNLVSYLSDIGVGRSLMPSDDELRNIKRLSHRRLTIDFHNLFVTRHYPPPVELTSEEEVSNWLSRHEDTFFKAPWSSSGRGVQRSLDMRLDKLLEWTGSVIRRQGSIMAEVAADKVLDLATEWRCLNGCAEYLGLSVFRTSGRGIYQGNLLLSQNELSGIVSAVCPEWSDKIISRQKDIIERIIAPEYDGNLGIDMLVDTRGHLNPCLEINLRTTMGHAAIEFFQRCFPAPVNNFIFFSGIAAHDK